MGPVTLQVSSRSFPKALSSCPGRHCVCILTPNQNDTWLHAFVPEENKIHHRPQDNTTDELVHEL